MTIAIANPAPPQRRPDGTIWRGPKKNYNGVGREPYLTVTSADGKTLLAMQGWEMADDKDGDSQLNNDRRPQDPPFIRVGATFASPDDEHSYGLGQNQEVYLDHRQHKVECWADYQSAGGPNFCVPFLVTNKGYGLIWDNPSKTTILPGFNEQTKWISQVGLRVSFFIIAGASTDEIYAGYRLLTGDTPMLPKWAYGLIQCKQRTTIQNYMYGGMNMACFNRTSEHTGRAHRTKYGLTAVRQSQSLRSIYGCGIRGGSIIRACKGVSGGRWGIRALSR